MAGATNRQLKTAGIPKAAMAQIRVHAGGRVSQKLALDVDERYGIAIPDRAHAFMAARDLKERKVALQAAGARGADASLANRVAAPNAAAVNKPLTWDKIATGYALNNGAARLEKNGKKWTLVTKDGERHEMPRKASFDHAERKLTELARQKSVSQPVDAAKGRGKSGAMGNAEEKANSAETRAQAAHDRAVAKRDAAEKAARYASFAGQPDAEKAVARAERAVERAWAKLSDARSAATSQPDAKRGFHADGSVNMRGKRRSTSRDEQRDAARMASLNVRHFATEASK